MPPNPVIARAHRRSRTSLRPVHRPVLSICEYSSLWRKTAIPYSQVAYAYPILLECRCAEPREEVVLENKPDDIYQANVGPIRRPSLHARQCGDVVNWLARCCWRSLQRCRCVERGWCTAEERDRRSSLPGARPQCV